VTSTHLSCVSNATCSKQGSKFFLRRRNDLVLQSYGFGKRDSLFGIVTRLRNGTSKIQACICVRGKKFFSYPECLDGIWGSSIIPVNECRVSITEVKWARREANHSPPLNVKVKGEWSYTLTSTYAFVLCTRLTILYSSISSVQTVRHCNHITTKGTSLTQNFTMIMFLPWEGYTTRFNRDATLHVAPLTR